MATEVDKNWEPNAGEKGPVEDISEALMEFLPQALLRVSRLYVYVCAFIINNSSFVCLFVFLISYPIISIFLILKSCRVFYFSSASRCVLLPLALSLCMIFNQSDVSHALQGKSS